VSLFPCFEARFICDTLVTENLNFVIVQ